MRSRYAYLGLVSGKARDFLNGILAPDEQKILRAGEFQTRSRRTVSLMRACAKMTQSNTNRSGLSGMILPDAALGSHLVLGAL